VHLENHFVDMFFSTADLEAQRHFYLEIPRGWSSRHGRRKQLLKPKSGKAAIRAELRGQGKEVYRGRSAWKKSRHDSSSRHESTQHRLERKHTNRLERKAGDEFQRSGLSAMRDCHNYCLNADSCSTDEEVDGRDKSIYSDCSETVFFRQDAFPSDVDATDVEDFDVEYSEMGCIVAESSEKWINPSAMISVPPSSGQGPECDFKEDALSLWELAKRRAEAVAQEYLKNVAVGRLQHLNQKQSNESVSLSSSLRNDRPIHLKRKSYRKRFSKPALLESQQAPKRRFERRGQRSYLLPNTIPCFCPAMCERFLTAPNTPSQGAEQFLQPCSESAPVEHRFAEFDSGECWTLGVAGFDGNVLVESLPVNSAASALSVQNHVNELLGMSLTLIMPDGTTLVSCGARVSLEEFGVEDGTIFTAILPICERALRNQLSFQQVVGDSLSRLESLIGNAEKFESLLRMLFNHLTRKKRSSTPVTDVVNQFRKNMGFEREPQWKLVRTMRAAYDGTTYSLNEECFSNFLRAIAIQAVGELKARLDLDSKSCAEAWLREELLLAGRGFLELQFSDYWQSETGYKDRARDARMRIWRHDASCQMILKPSSSCGTRLLSYKMYLLDGSFEIRGESVDFTWHHQGFSCAVEEDAEKVRTQKEIFVRRATPWTANGFPGSDQLRYTHASLQVHKVAIEDCQMSKGPKHASELQEVAAALQELGFAHYESGGF
jgi:hypothetical protein